MIKYLYNELAKRWLAKEGGAVWFYSDPHFGDTDVFKHRSEEVFKRLGVTLTIQELDEMQVKNINKCVGKNGTIVFLGDIGDLSYLKRIKGRKILIMGNHDEGNASKYERVIDEIQTFNSEDVSDEDREKIVANAERIMKDPKAVEELEFEKYFRQKTEDNHLFDEVYEGALVINDRIILTHEPIDFLPPFFYNIHGHDHAGSFRSKSHLNVCAEVVGFVPVSLNSIMKDGRLSHIDNIHRITIDGATERKAKRKGK